jgi:hypothetical protein
MIRYFSSNEIDKKKWDDCIHNSLNPSIFVYSWYLDVVCMNWGALILNDYEMVFPFAFNRKWRIRYIYQPFFTRYFGFYSSKPCSCELKQQFLNAIPSFFRDVKLCLNSDKENLPENFTGKQRMYQVLDLARPFEELKKNFSDNTKRNIKKAIKANLEIRHNIPSETIVKLFRETKGEELDTFENADYLRLNRLMETCLDRNCGETIAVYEKGKLCAAAFFMFCDGRFVFLKSGVTNLGKMKGAMHFLIASFIEAHAGNKKVLDFGGSSVESVARFYRSFGAIDCVYLQVEKNSIFKLIRRIKSFKL